MSENAESPSSPPITLRILKQEGATSTNAIVSYFQDSEAFLRWSNFLSNSIRQRDDEDGYKLHQGIDIAIQRGTLSELTDSDRVEYHNVDVLGKTPTDISNFIWDEVQRKKEALTDPEDGELIVLCGLSGTGKVRTLERLFVS